MNVIKTYGRDGEQNGLVVPLWHTKDPIHIDQVYLTTILPGKMKGPHLHKKRRGMFFCINGGVLLVTRDILNLYTTTWLQRGSKPAIVYPGTPAAIYNVGETEAILLNMPSPPWLVEEQDEWPVENWDYEL